MRFFSAILSVFLAAFWNAEARDIHAFKNYKGEGVRHMEIIGRVISHSISIEQPTKKILNYDTREKMITARLSDRNRVRVGDQVYIIKKNPNHEEYKNGYIVAKGEVYSIFKTELQGWLVTLKGVFTHVVQGHYIAVEKVRQSRSEAYVLLRKGDRSFFLKDYAEALAFYQSSLAKDQKRPETYLKLANVSEKLGQTAAADRYAREAWERRNHFEDTNAFLELPGIYLASENKNIEYHISERIKQQECSHVKPGNRFSCKSLKQALFVLGEIHGYKKRLMWFEHTLSPETLELLMNKGVPSYEFQYNFAKLMLSIKTILSGHFPRDIVFWLDKEEREILYQEIHLLHREKKSVHPKKIWDQAYLEAGLYHLELAHELNPLDPRAAISIIGLCHDELKKRPPRLKRENYVSIAEHYGRKLANLYQLKGYDWASVRSMLNNISQF